MTDLPLIAAAEWARTNSGHEHDPVEFGRKVAQAYCACQATQHHSGDEKTTAAALASLSIRPEVLQAIALLSSLGLPSTDSTCQTVPAGAGS